MALQHPVIEAVSGVVWKALQGASGYGDSTCWTQIMPRSDSSQGAADRLDDTMLFISS